MKGWRQVFLRGICVAVAVAAPAGFAQSAWAAQEGLRESLLRSRPSLGREFSRPPVARYVSERGEAFIFDRTQLRPLLKFEDSPEVWVLRSQPAPRGDVIYKNDLGQPMLRATRLGGFTLFTDARPRGAAVSLVGEGAPLRLALLSAQALYDRLLQASVPQRSGGTA